MIEIYDTKAHAPSLLLISVKRIEFKVSAQILGTSTWIKIAATEASGNYLVMLVPADTSNVVPRICLMAEIAFRDLGMLLPCHRF